MAEEGVAALCGPEEARLLVRLEEAHGNLRAALHWTSQSGGTELGLRFAGSLCRFWEVRGHLSEGRRWMELMLGGARAEGVPATGLERARAKGLNGAGRLAQCHGEYARAQALY